MNAAHSFAPIMPFNESPQKIDPNPSKFPDPYVVFTGTIYYIKHLVLLGLEIHTANPCSIQKPFLYASTFVVQLHMAHPTK